VVVERPLLGEADGALFEKLRGQPQWRTLTDRQGVVVLERRPVSATAAVAARRFPYECEIARIARNHL
jgi:hypothetical protein